MLQREGNAQGGLFGTLAGATWRPGAARSPSRSNLAQRKTALSQTLSQVLGCHPHFTAA